MKNNEILEKQKNKKNYKKIEKTLIIYVNSKNMMTQKILKNNKESN